MFGDEKLILIGYWFSGDKDDCDYPNPSTLINEEFYEINWKLENKLVGYLMAGKPCNFYRGSSECRICGCRLGCFERTDGIYIWPDKLEHYIMNHKVVLPTEFNDYVMKQNPWPEFKIDNSFWKSVYKNER